MVKYILALDLKNDPELIKQYDLWHQEIWPEITKSIQDSGITKMEIYRYQNRLFMTVEATDSFSFEQKNKMDSDNERVQEWERLMWTFQQSMPSTKPGEKWVLMNKIFEFNSKN